MKFTIRYKILIMVVSLGALALVIILGVIMPTITYINKIDRQTYELMVYLEKRYQSVARIRVSMRNFETIKEDIEDLNSRIFHAGDELKVITTLEDLSVKHKLTQKIESNELGNGANKNINFDITLDGTVKNLLSYLAELENNKYFLHVGHLQLTPIFSRKGEVADTAKLNINLVLYANK